LIISGAIYAAVPHIEFAPLSFANYPFLHNPKSVSFIYPSEEMTIFSGFKLN
jgi:hypothetical protein